MSVFTGPVQSYTYAFYCTKKRQQRRSPFCYSIPKTNTDNRNPIETSVAAVQISTFDLIYLQLQRDIDCCGIAYRSQGISGSIPLLRGGLSTLQEVSGLVPLLQGEPSTLQEVSGSIPLFQVEPSPFQEVSGSIPLRRGGSSTLQEASGLIPLFCK